MHPSRRVSRHCTQSAAESPAAAGDSLCELRLVTVPLPCSQAVCRRGATAAAAVWAGTGTADGQPPAAAAGWRQPAAVEAAGWCGAVAGQQAGSRAALRGAAFGAGRQGWCDSASSTGAAQKAVLGAAAVFGSTPAGLSHRLRASDSSPLVHVLLMCASPGCGPARACGVAERCHAQDPGGCRH